MEKFLSIFTPLFQKFIPTNVQPILVQNILHFFTIFTCPRLVWSPVLSNCSTYCKLHTSPLGCPILRTFSKFLYPSKLHPQSIHLPWTLSISPFFKSISHLPLYLPMIICVHNHDLHTFQPKLYYNHSLTRRLIIHAC
ncbi:hypothetical protein O6H91_21G051900 [Diphasiastrum complanatum]|uniref:Uncharacterized protein n=1 Tax=Diphasiastrum complanatum TaxID=34168 RepID=A0ACC2AKD7_DIPCM|nr:hypothetical protein O6H91_21G051900 [Diphasiastrum complanatum]